MGRTGSDTHMGVPQQRGVVTDGVSVGVVFLPGIETESDGRQVTD